MIKEIFNLDKGPFGNSLALNLSKIPSMGLWTKEDKCEDVLGNSHPPWTLNKDVYLVSFLLYIRTNPAI